MSPVDTVLNIHRAVQSQMHTGAKRLFHNLNAVIKCITIKLIVLKLKYVQQRQPVKHKENQSTHESSKKLITTKAMLMN